MTERLSVAVRHTVGSDPDVVLVVEVLDRDGRVVPAAPLRVEATVGPASATGRRDVVVHVENHGDAVDRSVRVRLEMADVADPWWLVPGVFYGENRPVDCTRLYPRFAVGGGDAQAMVSDHWDLRADRCATPAAFGWSGARGMALVADERTPLGMSSIGFAHDAAAATASAQVTFPYRESPVSYVGNAAPEQAEVTTWTWAPGQRTTLKVAAYLLADRHGYAAVLREAHARGRAMAPVTPSTTIHEAAEIAAYGLHRWHYDPDPGVLLETVGFDREVTGHDGQAVDRQAMHVGWVSGIPWAFALLEHARRVGRPDQGHAATRVINLICSALSPSGTFWGVWYRTGGWSQSWSPVAGALHARTLGEATLFLLRALALDDPDPGSGDYPDWVAAARSNLDVMVGRQRLDGNLGALHHAETGEVLSWEGTAGLIWVAALAEAASLDPDGRYLRAAERAGEYYAAFVERELLFGAPEDVDLAPSSEDGYAAVMAYVALHRRTGDARWLDLARRAADWMLTFRYTYNVTFEPRTLLGVYGFASRGADQASPSNQHLHAYGLICTRELVELSAALGDDHYRERALESLTCFRQLIPRHDGELNAYRGMITERYYQTACFQPKGMLLTLSHAWSVGVLLLACEQAVALGLTAEPG